MSTAAELEALAIEMLDNDLYRCAKCRKVTSGLEATERIINTGKCGYCGGDLNRMVLDMFERKEPPAFQLRVCLEQVEPPYYEVRLPGSAIALRVTKHGLKTICRERGYDVLKSAQAAMLVMDSPDVMGQWADPVVLEGQE